jgi:T5orf172 domain
MVDLSDDELLDALGVEIKTETKTAHTPLEERMIAGFEDIQRFVQTNGRKPQHGEERDIFERLYAVRLDRIRALSDALVLLKPLDYQGVLSGEDVTLTSAETLTDDDLLAELGIEDGLTDNDPTHLRHVRPRAEVRAAAEEIGTRTRCADFETFKPLFARVQKELETGLRETRPFELKAEIEAGRWFIVGGQKAFVAEKGDIFPNDAGHRDARLRIIFDNGTESNMLMRSLQRALNKDEAGRRITDPNAGPLFSNIANDEDQEAGTIYVVRSKSNLPQIVANRDLIHKIGVSGNLDRRFSNAALEASYLLADVELVAAYELFNINRHKLEGLLHRFFANARVDLEINDRFGNPVRPKEWFLVPLNVIDQVVRAIENGTISNLRYDVQSACLLPIE